MWLLDEIWCKWIGNDGLWWITKYNINITRKIYIVEFPHIRWHMESNNNKKENMIRKTRKRSYDKLTITSQGLAWVIKEYISHTSWAFICQVRGAENVSRNKHKIQLINSSELMREKTLKWEIQDETSTGEINRLTISLEKFCWEWLSARIHKVNAKCANF